MENMEEKNEIQNYSDNNLYLEMLNRLTVTNRIVRIIVVVLVMTSILLFVGFWNSVEFGWTESRINILEKQLYWVEHLENKSKPTDLSAEENILFNKCKEYWDSKCHTKETLIAEINCLRTAKINNIIFFNVPFLGITFDINDLGMIGGFSLTIIYFLLLYSFLNKHNQLEVIFKKLDTINNTHFKNNAYYLIAMDQVLTVPRDSIKEGKNLRKFPRLLYIIPIVVFIFVLIYDLYTFSVGVDKLDSIAKTIIGYITSFIFFIIMIFELIYCLHIIIKTDILWNENFPKNFLSEE